MGIRVSIVRRSPTRINFCIFWCKIREIIRTDLDRPPKYFELCSSAQFRVPNTKHIPFYISVYTHTWRWVNSFCQDKLCELKKYNAFVFLTADVRQKQINIENISTLF